MSDPADLVGSFWSALADREVDAAVALLATDADVRLYAAGTHGGPDAVRAFWEESMAAFPDLLLELVSTTTCDDGRVLCVVRFEGTQAADFQGAINQEKHLDLEQAWLFGTSDGRITTVGAYWDQNKLYRRLAVKRLDQIAIA